MNSAGRRPERVVARGVGAVGGQVVGRAYGGLDAAIDAIDRGEPVVLLREWTVPADEAVMRHCAAVVTRHGGRSSHAAVVCREWGVTCVVGVAELRVASQMAVGSWAIEQGAWVAVDGRTGTVEAVGSAEPTSAPILPSPVLGDPEADVVRRLAQGGPRVRLLANADSAQAAEAAIEAGASGIGLCRSEHFFGPEELVLLRTLIGTDPAGDQPDRSDVWGRSDAWDRFEELHRRRVQQMVSVLGGRPLTVRLLDIASHELGDADTSSELNPMLGTRGVRTALRRPDIYRRQLRGILRGALHTSDDTQAPELRILVPLAADPGEVTAVRELLDPVLHDLAAEPNERCSPNAAPKASKPPKPPKVSLGVMIETPRAALLSARFAEVVDFVSFGTNDLTQLVWGMSRDDADRELEAVYSERRIWSASPFAVLDTDGVGALIASAIENARNVNPQIPIGACGEQCADPASARWLVEAGVDSLSCSAPALVGLHAALAGEAPR